MQKIILVGDINTGKTTLLSALISSDAKESKIINTE